ncbi:hypothetical protein G7046_g3045 [Stylonectria norvegica]|nr:hypothetical protein G7046_g3045 [Stylonectria norvegica]
MSAINLNFRLATLDDAPQLKDQVQAAFRSDDIRQNWTADMDLSSRFVMDIEEIINSITRPDGVTLVATTEDNTIVGSVGVWKKTADLARISMLAVDQQQQRGGIGHRLLSHAESYCQETWGVGKTGLNALSPREQLIAWYERCGYVRTGEQTPFRLERLGVDEKETDMFFVEMEKVL